MDATIAKNGLSKNTDMITSMHAREACQNHLNALVAGAPSLLFASVSLVDGRSYAHADNAGRGISAPRTAAITSSLLGLIESFSREALESSTSYNSIATERGSVVIVRVPSKRRVHALCLCADSSENLAMVIRTALDAAAALAELIDTPP